MDDFHDVDVTVKRSQEEGCELVLVSFIEYVFSLLSDERTNEERISGPDSFEDVIVFDQRLREYLLSLVEDVVGQEGEVVGGRRGAVGLEGQGLLVAVKLLLQLHEGQFGRRPLLMGAIGGDEEFYEDGQCDQKKRLVPMARPCTHGRTCGRD